MEDRAADTELVRAVRSGGTDALAALEALYRAHADRVYTTAYRVLANRADAQDVLQDVFTGLPRALQSYREVGMFTAWLQRIAVRAALMRLRSQRRQRECDLDLLPVVQDRGNQGDALDLIALRNAIARLPEALRIVFMLRVVEGYSHADVAELIGISAGASATRVSRAWDILRKELAP